MKYTILENGLDFVLRSLQDLLEFTNIRDKIVTLEPESIKQADIDSTDSVLTVEKLDNDEEIKRLIKYSLLHLSSGIELILKYRLLSENWAYVYSDINKADYKKYQLGDFQSADSKTIIDRLTNLCKFEISKDDKKELENLRKKRNRMEHFNINENILSIESTINKAITVLIKLIKENYDINKFSAKESELFLQLTHQLRKFKKHYEQLKQYALEKLKENELDSVATICPVCGEQFLIRNCNGSVKCFFCNYEGTVEEAIDEYLYNILDICSFEYAKDGGEIPVYECPECGANSLLFDFTHDRAICYNCEFDAKTSNFRFCNECGNPYFYNDEFEEDTLEICPSCIDYRISRA